MAKTPGVGYQLPEGSTATWVDAEGKKYTFPIDLAAHPWGPSGGVPGDPSIVNLDDYLRRYFGGNDNLRGGVYAQGMWGELVGNNQVALEGWFKDQPKSHQDQWSGVPTQEEIVDLAVSEDRRTSKFYAMYWWSSHEGSSKEAPIVIAGPEDYRQWSTQVERARQLGSYSTKNSLGYTKWFNIQWLPEGLPSLPEPPAVGAKVEAWDKMQGKLVPGEVIRVQGDDITIRLSTTGKSVTHSMADEDRLWGRGKSGLPTPTPTPTPTPAPSPAPLPDLATMEPWRVAAELAESIQIPPRLAPLKRFIFETNVNAIRQLVRQWQRTQR